MLQDQRNDAKPVPAESDGAEPAESDEDAPITISARKARGGGLGFENRKEELRFAAAAGLALFAVVAVAVVTSVMA